MEIYQNLSKRRTGFMDRLEYEHKMNHLMYSRVQEESYETIVIPSRSEIVDFDLQDNWLLASHSRFHATIYNVTYSKDNNYEPAASWKHSCDKLRNFPLECINWNSNMRLFTVTGNSPNVFLVDTDTCSTIEMISIPGAEKIYQHKPQPHNNALIAVASSVRHVPLVDAKSGNVSFTVKTHQSKVRSVSWSSIEEFLLASSSDDELYLWDIRKLKKPLNKMFDYNDFYRVGYPVGLTLSPLIIPDVQFFPDTNKLILLSPFSTLFVTDTDQNSITSEHIQGFEPNTRYKLSLIGFCNPPLYFKPNGVDISLIELSTFDEKSRLAGHVFPVRLLIFNSLKNELYSVSKEGCIVWVTEKF